MNKAEQPVIGITGYGLVEVSLKTAHNDTHFSSPTPYADAVMRAGGIPVIIPPLKGSAQSLLARLDGIIFSGGADIHPSFYEGTEDHPDLLPQDRLRDEVEQELIRHAITMPDLPILGICRGAQLLNVTLGGTLLQHLPDHIDDDIHRSSDGMWTMHDVNIVADSKLAQAMGANHIHTTSGHHQAMDKVADVLRITASSVDKVVEAVELPTHPWCIAVQWHPEQSAADDETQQRLFDALVERAKT